MVQGPCKKALDGPDLTAADNLLRRTHQTFNFKLKRILLTQENPKPQRDTYSTQLKSKLNILNIQLSCTVGQLILVCNCMHHFEWNNIQMYILDISISYSLNDIDK